MSSYIRSAFGAVSSSMGFGKKSLPACDNSIRDPFNDKDRGKIVDQFNHLKNLKMMFSGFSDTSGLYKSQFSLSLVHFLSDRTIDELIQLIQKFLDDGLVNGAIHFYCVDLDGSFHPDTTHIRGFRVLFKGLGSETEIKTLLGEFTNSLMEVRCKILNGERVATKNLLYIMKYIYPSTAPVTPREKKPSIYTDFEYQHDIDEKHKYNLSVRAGSQRRTKRYKRTKRTKRTKRSKRTRRSKN